MSVPAWKGLFDWSIQNQSPAESAPRKVTPEEQKWFEEAMSQYTIDHVKRMKHIKATLDNNATNQEAVQQKEDMLDELLDIVDNIDYARDLHTIGGLPTLLKLLQDPEASVRWRAAEVVATCVQNNPPVQQWFMEGGAMPKLLQLMHNQDGLCRAKALLALSCLIRLSPLALEVFRQKRGVPQLVGAASDSDPRVQKKALHLLRHVVQGHPPDAAAACELGALAKSAELLSNADDDTWQAALALLQQLSQHTSALQLMRQHSELTRQLQALEARLASLTGEDQEATVEELAHCRYLLKALSSTSQSGAAAQDERNPAPPAQPAVAAQAGHHEGIASHNNVAASNAPLLLGPP